MSVRIAIDMSIAQINQAGTGIYATNLVNNLQRIDSRNDYQIFAVDQNRDMSSRKSLAMRVDTLYRDLIWTHVILPWKVAQVHSDILHMPANVLPIVASCKTVVTILDAIILKSPDKFPPWHRTYARLLVPLSARRAKAILTISEQSKQDIVKLLGVPSEKVVVTYLGAGSEFTPAANSEITRVRQDYNLAEFILTVGALEPRKNMIRLLQAFSQVQASGYKGLLVHAGPKGWLYDDVLAEVKLLGLQESVRFLGRVPLKDLTALYSAANLFVYPSLYEGFGLPILEAMSCGCPVVTSNLSSMPEVAGDAALLVDPYSIKQIVSAIRSVLEDPLCHARLIERGFAQARNFSWDRCAHETLKVYNWVNGMH